MLVFGILNSFFSGMFYGLPRNCNGIRALLWTSRNKSYCLQEKCVLLIQEI